MPKLSVRAWHTCAEAICAIKKHPFNTELASGSLAIDKFAYYMEQDTLYLRDFARALSLIASRALLKQVREFLAFSEATLIVEQEVVHHFFRATYGFQETGFFTPATVAYTRYLLQICSTAPVEVAIAAVLPCFWVYREIGVSIADCAGTENPYSRWIDAYSGEEFGESVRKAIDIFDDIALCASEETKDKMIEAFYKSTVLEWHFWNDAYHQTIFDGFLRPNT